MISAERGAVMPNEFRHSYNRSFEVVCIYDYFECICTTAAQSEKLSCSYVCIVELSYVSCRQRIQLQPNVNIAGKSTGAFDGAHCSGTTSESF